MTSLRTTHRSTVTEDQIDHLGHMNVRFYGINAGRGTAAITEPLELPPGLELRLADVYTRHHREQLLGAELVVHSGLVDVDEMGIRLYHELADEASGGLAATFVHQVESVTADGDPSPLPHPVVEQLAARRLEIPPHGATRSISLDRAAPVPALDVLRARNLAMRKVRVIEPDECDAHGTLRSDATPGLTWGGVPLDGDRYLPLHDDSDGGPMGWATMETRMSTLRLPRVGDRIQSFGAAVAIRDKTSHRIQWAFDVDRGDVLTIFEVVNLAFDIAGRRAISIPEHLREIEEAQLHPDLTATSPR